MNVLVNIHRESSQRSSLWSIATTFPVNILGNLHCEPSQEYSQQVHRELHCDDPKCYVIMYAGIVTVKVHRHDHRENFTVIITENSQRHSLECSLWTSLRIHCDIHCVYAVNTQWRFFSTWVGLSTTYINHVQ